jgi:2-dehydro-3-deoxyphosphooctonate aldolase (KDO 8-P synthase)
MNTVKHVNVAGIDCGSDDLFLMMMQTAERLKKISEKLDLPLIFKSSFTKDNRSSLDYFQGPGIDEGMRILGRIKNEIGLPVLTDIHYPEHAAPAAEVCDILQIPAYLCMQTELVTAAARTGAVVNLKHGQFIAPDNMIKPVQKIEAVGGDKIILTERGYTFGGTRQYLNVIGRSGVAAGIDGIFVEAHPNPPDAVGDAASQYYLDDLEDFLNPLLDIHNLVRKQPH